MWKITNNLGHKSIASIIITLAVPSDVGLQYGLNCFFIEFNRFRFLARFLATSLWI